jgi:photosystem II stability/assembly factor-like uncharacterized protein
MRTVLKTTNGGTTWATQQIPPASDYLWSIYFPVDPDTGYIAGDAGIFKTTNGGTNWVLQSSTYSNLFTLNFPVNAQTGYAAGRNTIAKTTNGGISWTRQDSTHIIVSIYFPVDGQTGYAVGGDFSRGLCTILKTTDGGSHWVAQDPGSSTSLYSVFFPLDNSTGYAVGSDGTILKTTDGGASFVEDQPSVRPLNGLTVGRLKIIPNPFISFATVPGHEAERFALFDIAGRRVGTYKGDRVGDGLAPGVYFLRGLEREAGLGRIVKVR